MSTLKLKIVEKKIDNQSTIMDLVNSSIPSSWEEVFKSASEELEFISGILKKHESTHAISFPFKNNIFRAFQLTPVSKIKAVFINAEPYSGVNYDGLPLSDGLAFSVNESCTIPKDLNSLYAEISRVVPTFKIPTHGNLTKWALEGILLLNLALTVTPGEPKSHGEIWIGFIAKVLEHLAIHKPKVPYILFGENVKSIANLISGQALIISTSNPSYTSKFIQSNCIKLLVDNLQKQETTIDWNL